MQRSIFCDESNHLEHSSARFMTLGFIECKANKVREANIVIRNLKEKHGLSRTYELKWTKVSMGLIPFYNELIEYFFDSEFLKFRCVIADKSQLDYKTFLISHDDWYYRMYYLLLGKTLKEDFQYNIYLDIKDTCSKKKVSKLKEVLNNSYFSFSSSMIKKIQQVHSHEIELIQLCDLFIGAIGYNVNEYNTSQAKLKVVDCLQKHSGFGLYKSTPLNESKFNLFMWESIR